jgi:hypothetical protein
MSVRLRMASKLVTVGELITPLMRLLTHQGGCILLAEVDRGRLRTVERELILEWQPKWNVQDRKKPPKVQIQK